MIVEFTRVNIGTLFKQRGARHENDNCVGLKLAKKHLLRLRAALRRVYDRALCNGAKSKRCSVSPSLSKPLSVSCGREAGCFPEAHSCNLQLISLYTTGFSVPCLALWPLMSVIKYLHSNRVSCS